MKSFLLPALLLSTALSSVASAETASFERPALEEMQASIDAEIIAAELEIAALQDGPLKSLKATRIETLKLNRTIVQTYLLGAASAQPISIPSVMPDLEMEAQIRAEIDVLDLQIAETQKQISATTGAVVVLPIVKLETDRLTRSLLQGALMRAKYGVISPVLKDLPKTTLPGSEAVVLDPPESIDPGSSAPVAPPDGDKKQLVADPRYPQVDYSSPALQQGFREGLKINGWWMHGFSGSSYTMLNASRAKTESLLSSDRRLLLACGEQAVVSIHTGTVLQLGGQEQVQVKTATDWSETTGTWLVGRDEDGDSLYVGDIWALLEIRDSDRVSYTLQDVNGEIQSFDFEVYGIKETLDEAFTRGFCSLDTVSYVREDIAFFQGKLNEAGYSVGQVDGSFGPGTQEALRRYQHDKGLPTTGRFDYQTIIAMGIFNRKPETPIWKKIFGN